MRISPWQAVEDDLRIAFAGLGHEPELVAARLGISQFLAGDDMGGLAAAGGVLAAADLHLEMLEPGAEFGLEQKVQDLAALRLGVVREQPRGGARADGADALEHAPG